MELYVCMYVYFNSVVHYTSYVNNVKDKSNKFKHTQNLGQQPKVSRTVAGWFPTRVGLIKQILDFSTAHSSMTPLTYSEYHMLQGQTWSIWIVLWLQPKRRTCFCQKVQFTWFMRMCKNVIQPASIRINLFHTRESGADSNLIWIKYNSGTGSCSNWTSVRFALIVVWTRQFRSDLNSMWIKSLVWKRYKTISSWRRRSSKCRGCIGHVIKPETRYQIIYQIPDTKTFITNIPGISMNTGKKFFKMLYQPASALHIVIANPSNKCIVFWTDVLQVTNNVD